MEIFQQFFEHVVELCIGAGLVWGKELYVDATKIRANADVDSLVERTGSAAEQHLEQLFKNGLDQSGNNNEENLTVADLVNKYDSKRILGPRKPSYERVTDKKVSLTDPDATPIKPSGGVQTVLGYRNHYVVDGGQDRIILSVLVTPASILDNTSMFDSKKPGLGGPSQAV